MKNIITLTLTVAFIGSGCTHTARITKMPVAESSEIASQPSRPVKVGFTPVGNQSLLQSAINDIQVSPSIKDSQPNFNPASDFNPDYICQLSMQPKFKASGQNFFIAFPGFIVFTHALIGYKYKADLTTQSILLDAQQNQISEKSIEAPFEFRHCSFARGAAAGCCGWLLPGYGAAAIIPGAIFAGSYDKRATDEFFQKVQTNYSAYVSAQVLGQIKEAEGARTLTKPSPSSESTSLPQAERNPLEVKPDGHGVDQDVDALSTSEFGVYVMRVNVSGDGMTEIGVPEVRVKSLSPHARQTLDLMSRTGLAANEDAMSELLLEMDISPGDFFGGLSEARVYTQVGADYHELERIHSEERTGI